MQIERMCTFCKQEYPPLFDFSSSKITPKKTAIRRDNISDFILFKKSVYHLECFMRKIETDNSKKSTAIYKILLSESLENFIENLSLETKAHFEPLFIKEEIYSFIREQYSIKNVPTYIFTKLKAIYGGTFKGMGTKIPPEHLFDMWKRKINELNKISQQNITRGNPMTAEQRLSYDLSILVNKYDSYLKWLNKQEIIASDSKLDNRKQRIDFTLIEKLAEESLKTSNKEEIDKFLEELF